MYQILHLGLHVGVHTHPPLHASYTVSVRQYKPLQYGLLQMYSYPYHPCHLLILRSVNPRIRDFHSLASLVNKLKNYIYHSGHTHSVESKLGLHRSSYFWNSIEVSYFYQANRP